jgi:hypothetical protein
LRPLSPSFFSASSCGDTLVSSWTIMEAEMYGMMLRAKIDMRLTAPPANMSNRPRMPPFCELNTEAMPAGSTPGNGR